MEFFFVPLILFITVVLPLWIVFHYLTVWKRERRNRRSARQDRGELHQQADKLEERLDAIECILDHDAPEWRKQA